MGPVCGTPPGWPGMSSLTAAASFAKSTSAWNGLKSPAASASPWCLSRHQAGPVEVPAGSPTTGIGSS